MIIYKYETLYPRLFWIVNFKAGDSSEEESQRKTLLETFNIIDHEKDADDWLKDGLECGIAQCISVREIETGKLGVLLVIWSIDEIDDAEIIAHESVHVADYICEECGIYSQDFSDGNEHYAYLVGWAAKCFDEVLNKERGYGKQTKRERKK